MRTPTSPLAWLRLQPRVRYSLGGSDDERKQHVIDVLNSFTREEWLSLLILFNRPWEHGCHPLETVRGALRPIPFETMGDLEKFVTDPRLLVFSRRDYESAKELLNTVSKNWLGWTNTISSKRD